MRPRNKCKINHNFFNEINTESNAYWLGFLMADGHINDKIKSGALQLHIHLSKRDKEHLKNFHTDICSTNKILIGNDNDIISNHSSDILCGDLIKLGCTPRKSLILKFPNKVPKHLVNHFIRGYFDGDGSTCLHKGRLFIDFLGTKTFLTKLNKFLPIQKNVRIKKENLYVLNFSDIKGCKEIYKFMYHNSTIHLVRKKEVFEKWLKIEKKGSGKYIHKKIMKEVVQKDLNGNKIKEWPSLLSINKELGYSIGSISLVCQKKRKTSKGFIWDYKNY
jgi:hypothetical protein